jgi:hypothetical protein
VLIDVLLTHRPLPHAAVVAGMTAVLTAGSVDPEVVLVDGRRERRTVHRHVSFQVSGGVVPR